MYEQTQSEDHKGPPPKNQVAEFQDYAELPLFKDVNIDNISTLLGCCHNIRLRPGDQLLSPQHPNEKMYVVLSGLLSIHLTEQKNDPITLLKQGECVGELSVFDGKEPSAYVVAEETSELLVIDRTILWSMVDISHSIARNLLHLLSHRIRSGNHAYTDSKQSVKEHEQRANLGPLTGLYNRRWIDRMFVKEIKHAKQERRALSLIMIDIDHFKSLNDDHGHLVGDDILKLVSSNMMAMLRPGEMVARYGGEEFVILLPNTTKTVALKIAERIRKGIEKLQYVDKSNDKTIDTTISAGVAQLTPSDTLKSLINSADQALYSAKESGRNKVCS